MPDSEIGKVLPQYIDHDVEMWIKVSDLYVLAADHDGNIDPILDKLADLSLVEDLENPVFNEDKLITPYMSNTRHPSLVLSKDIDPIFLPISYEEYSYNSLNPCKEIVWLNTHRRLSKEYMTIREHIKGNFSFFVDINSRTEHFLTEFEMLKFEAAEYHSMQKLRILKQAFECYISAVINELNGVFGWHKEHKFHDVILFEVNQIQVSKGNERVIELIKTAFNPYAKDTIDFLFYAKFIKYGYIENILEQIASKLPDMTKRYIQRTKTLKLELSGDECFMNNIEALKNLRNWFAHGFYEFVTSFENRNVDYQKEPGDEIICALTKFISIISQPSISKNIFYKIAELKTGKRYNSSDMKLDALASIITDNSKKIEKFKKAA